LIRKEAFGLETAEPQAKKLPGDSAAQKPILLRHAAR
jgi:hypothetical protein